MIVTKRLNTLPSTFDVGLFGVAVARSEATAPRSVEVFGTVNAEAIEKLANKMAVEDNILSI